MVRALRSSLMRFARVWCILRSYFSLLHYCRRSCIFLSRILLFPLSSFPFFFPLFPTRNHQLEKDWFNLWTNWHSWCGRSIDITVNRFRILLIRIPIRRIALIPFCRRNCRSNVRIMCRVSGFLIRRRPFLAPIFSTRSRKYNINSIFTRVEGQEKYSCVVVPAFVAQKRRIYGINVLEINSPAYRHCALVNDVLKLCLHFGFSRLRADFAFVIARICI